MTSFSLRSWATRPCCHRFSKKSGEFSPLDHTSGGGPAPFPKFGERIVWVPGIFPGSCFSRGGGSITPCSPSKTRFWEVTGQLNYPNPGKKGESPPRWIAAACTIFILVWGHFPYGTLAPVGHASWGTSQAVLRQSGDDL